MNNKYLIFVETITGEIIRAFTWTRDPQSGIDQARREAVSFGYSPLRVWAKRI
jgi:hypothetical protein